MDNVILKDNLLTADFKSNKVIQAEIIEMTESVDEKIFNLFCYKQLLHQSLSWCCCLWPLGSYSPEPRSHL